ncbi:hypothetical protein FOL47_002453 [Perkinsus chesapeaki]|uniref:Uncharacterized protein n=1 Tax=Perkinsus chesapeaki TaxID=330153 RepID=A0A7J6MD95_PERCH|nr:hypothetical protein FOL47_002453 [Perkinsus chesapeaki]
MSNLPNAPKFDEASLEAELRNMGFAAIATGADCEGDGIETLFKRGNTDDDIRRLIEEATTPKGRRLSSSSSMDSLNDPTLLNELAAMSEEEDPREVDKIVKAAKSKPKSTSGPTSDELLVSLGLNKEDDYYLEDSSMAAVEAADPHAPELLVSLAVMEWYLSGDGPIKLTDDEKEELNLQVRTITLDAQSGRLSPEKYIEDVKDRINKDEAMLEYLTPEDRTIVEKRIAIAKDEIKEEEEEEPAENDEKYEDYRRVVLRRLKEYQRAAAALAGVGFSDRARDMLHKALELKNILEGGAKQCRLAIKENLIPPSMTDEVLMGQSEVDRRALIDQLEQRLGEVAQMHKDHALFCLKLSQSPELLDPPAHGQVARRLATGKNKPEEIEEIKKLKDEAVMHNTLRKNAEKDISWLKESRNDRWQFVPNELEKRAVRYTVMNENDQVDEMGHMKISFDIPSSSMRYIREWSEDYPIYCELTLHGIPSGSEPYLIKRELTGNGFEDDVNFSHMRQTSIERAFGKAKITVKLYRQRNALASLFGSSLKEIAATPGGLKLDALQTGTTWLTRATASYCVLPTPLPPTINNTFANEKDDDNDHDLEQVKEEDNCVVDPNVSPLDPSLWVSVEAIEDRLRVVTEESERTPLECRMNELIAKIQSGDMSFEEYVETMKASIDSDIKLAINLKQQNRTHEAAIVYKRAKVMKETLKSAEEDGG